MMTDEVERIIHEIDRYLQLNEEEEVAAFLVMISKSLASILPELDRLEAMYKS